MKYCICFLLLVLTSCSDKKLTIKGDLYFKLIGFSNPNGFSEELVVKIEKYLDSVSDKEDRDDKSTKYFRILRENNLLRSPSILIKTEDNAIKTIFLSKSEYEKIKPFTLAELRKRGKKLQLEINVKELDSNLYFSDKIIDFKEIDGETRYSK